MVGGLVHFGRMLDKLRLDAQDRLPADYEVQTVFDIIDADEGSLARAARPSQLPCTT
jgi:hypothetical protein